MVPMTLGEARAQLGVTASDPWEVVRTAYRDRIRRSHPDLAGDAGIDRSVVLNTAYRTLSHARRDGRLHEPDDVPAPRPAAPTPATRPTRPWIPAPGTRVADDVRVLDNTTLVLASTPAETFRRLVEATHALGEISYIDRGSAIFEAVLSLADGTPASFVVSLQWRAHDASCEAFCTLEALDRAESLDVSGVLAQLVPFIGPDLEQ